MPRINNFFAYLDTVGNGTGSSDGAVDASGADVVLKYVPTKGVKIHRMLVFIRDSGAIQAERYGAISNGLTNGILMIATDGTESVDLMGGLPVKSNADWSRNCYDMQPLTFGSGDNFVNVRWTFAKSGIPLIMEAGDSLEVTLQDDLSGLVEHRFKIEGYAS